jgi:hypothetical protein
MDVEHNKPEDGFENSVRKLPKNTKDRLGPPGRQRLLVRVCTVSEQNSAGFVKNNSRVASWVPNDGRVRVPTINPQYQSDLRAVADS